MNGKGIKAHEVLKLARRYGARLTLANLMRLARRGDIQTLPNPANRIHRLYVADSVKKWAIQHPMELPKGYASPAEVLKKFPKLSLTMLKRWYSKCPPIERPLRMWPEDLARHQRRWIRIDDIELATQWYRDELPDRFSHEKLGQLTFAEAAAKDIGVSKVVFYEWAGERGCGALGGIEGHRTHNRQLRLFRFFKWRDFLHRSYVRQSDVDEIVQFQKQEDKRADRLTLDEAEAEGITRHQFTNHFSSPNKTRKINPRPHPATNTTSAGVRRVKKEDRRGNIRFLRLKTIPAAAVDSITSFAPQPDKEWSRRCDLNKLFAYGKGIYAVRSALDRWIKTNSVRPKLRFAKNGRAQKLYPVKPWLAHMQSIWGQPEKKPRKGNPNLSRGGRPRKNAKEAKFNYRIESEFLSANRNGESRRNFCKNRRSYRGNPLTMKRLESILKWAKRNPPITERKI